MENLLIIFVVALAAAVFFLWRKNFAAHNDRRNEWRDKFEQAQTAEAVAATRADHVDGHAAHGGAHLAVGAAKPQRRGKSPSAAVCCMTNFTVL